ncbi:MAG: MotA/TolQ/ExbB proton channel family protein [Ruminiclostridium sp.]|nr:MotA/TolQ/ExbB proton channel family protein [Ruminiclostridium sp.]
MLKAVFGNLIGFDGIIMLLGIFNFWVMYKAYNAARELVAVLGTDGLCQADMRKNGKKSGKRLKDKDIIALRNKAEGLYTWYVNISAVFPLLGILGTVIALIGMKDMGNDSSFLLALTSTFWGLVFSIIFKSLQTIVEAKLDEGVNEAERCLGIAADRETEAGKNEKA